MYSEVAEQCIQGAIVAETKNAIENYGENYSSLHEAYGVLLEEVEEAYDEMEAIKNKLEWVWTAIRQNRKPSAYTQLINSILENAENLAIESCQIASVCTKFEHTLKDMKDD